MNGDVSDDRRTGIVGRLVDTRIRTGSVGHRLPVDG